MSMKQLVYQGHVIPVPGSDVLLQGALRTQNYVTFGDGVEHSLKTCYCAIGWVLHHAGVSDDVLADADNTLEILDDSLLKIEGVGDVDVEELIDLDERIRVLRAARMDNRITESDFVVNAHGVIERAISVLEDSCDGKA